MPKLPPEPARVELQIGRVRGNGEFDVEAVGESNYQDALRAIVGPGEVRHKCTAHLIMEVNNPYDPKAVMVQVDHALVGYLSRDDARTYRKLAEPIGDFAGEVDIVIVGGGNGRSLGVWLDMNG